MLINIGGAKRYKAYEPTKWEDRLDRAIAILSPNRALQRSVSREKMNYFRYLAAQSNPGRRNASYQSAGEIARTSREKLQLMWNAIEAVDNSGLCSGILSKLGTYTTGTLRYQARTGDKSVNDEYEAYMREKCGRAIDLTGRFTLRQMMMLDIKGIALKGDIGTNIVRQGSELYLQGIEADRIGNPYEWKISNRYVRGLIINDAGAIVAAKIFKRNRASGQYVFDDIFDFYDENGLPKFLFSVNPISYDDYRGVTLFKTAIDNAAYLDRMRAYELQAMLWASSQSGVYYTKSGGLPEGMPFDRRDPIVDASGNQLDSFEVRPNTVVAMSAEGEKVEMFKTERPSPNVIAMFHDTIRDIAVGTDLSYGFIYDLSGLSGPAVRQASAQDARTIQVWQEMLRETKLDIVRTLILGNGIANGEIKYHPKWTEGVWFFPAKTTIDVGRESAANINEIDAMINTGAQIAAENSQDIDEIITQRGVETETAFSIAIETAKRLSKMTGTEIDWREVYAAMRRGKQSGSALQEAAVAGVLGNGVSNEDGPGATSSGADLDNGEEEEMRRGSGPRRELITIRHEFSAAPPVAPRIASDTGKKSYAMLTLSPEQSKPIQEFVDSIPEEELYVDGGVSREKESHVTLLYGIAHNDPKKITKLVENRAPVDFALKQTALMPTDKPFDILIVEVEGENVKPLHDLLFNSQPNENEHPVFKPHLTLAYLKKGVAAKYVGDSRFKDMAFSVPEITFVNSAGERTEIPLPKKS